MFLFDRCCIIDDETPKALEIEQDHVIEFVLGTPQLHYLAPFLTLWESRHS